MQEKNLGQIVPDIKATATIDNTVGVPEVTVTVEELNELNRLVSKFNFVFSHMKGEKGDKPVKGVDYYTEEEKQQFTNETNALVTAEGTKQIGLIGNKGNEQVSLVSGEATKVIEQLKSLIAGNPETSNAQTLSGKTRVEFEKDVQALAGKYAGNFPLTSAVKDSVYLLPATGKFYVCTQTYNGSSLTAPNANFEELSVWKNHNKLENLKYSALRVEMIQKNFNTLNARQNANFIYLEGVSIGCVRLTKGKLCKINLPPDVKIYGTQFLVFDEFGASILRMEITSDGTINILSINNQDYPNGSFIVNETFAITRY